MNIKKIVSIGVSALIGFSGVFSLTSALPAAAAENDSILVLGDSIASGYNASTSFGKITADYFNADYMNAAVPGYTTTDLLNSIEANKNSIDDYDSVVISSGGNNYLDVVTDVLNNYLDEGDTLETLTEEKALALRDKIMADKENAMTHLSSVTAVTDPAAADISKAVAQIKELNPDAKIYVLTLYNPFESAASYDDVAEMMNDIANSVLGDLNTKISAIDGVTSVPVDSAFKGLTTSYVRIAQKDIHPNDAGHIKIASLLINKMTGENEKTVLGKIFGTLTDAQLAALPDVLKEGVEIIKPEVTTTAVTVTTAATTTNISETTTAVSDTGAVTTTSVSSATTTTAASSSVTTTAASTTTSTVSSSPATSDKGINALILTGIFSAAACVFLRKNRV